jgi:arabinan endo-1,5-alpha-L-arabinosidase
VAARATLPRRGLAPDVIHIGDRYYVYVAANIGAQPKAAVDMIWNRTLDPESPDYKWEEGGVVASSDGIEDSNAIDPGVFLDPGDGRLWLVYGSYFGYIRLVELDPKTGTRKDPNDSPRDLAINCEAATMIFHDGFYYLLATHGSCCRGADSGYNIRVGRSRKVTGPFLDHTGVDMIRGGGMLLVGVGWPGARPRPFRSARPGRWRTAILAALRSRPRPRGRQRARHPAAALEGRMARGR